MLTVTASSTSRDATRAYAIRDGGAVYADCLTLSEAGLICRRVNLKLAVEAYLRAERVATLLGFDPERMADRLHEEMTRQAIANGWAWSANQTTLEWAQALIGRSAAA